MVVNTDSFIATLHRHSTDATCIFLGFALPDDVERDAMLQEAWVKMLDGLPTTILVNNAGSAEVLG